MPVKSAKKIRCAGCKIPIGRHEPDLVLRNLAVSGKPRYYHTRCIEAAYAVASALPAVYRLTHRYVSGDAN